MGKARIVSGGADGLYTVRIERDLARVRRRIEALTLERARLSAQIAQQLQIRAAAADALLLATGAATDAWSALPAGDADGYQAAMRAAAEAQMKAQTAEAVLAIADSDLGLLRLRDQAAEADIQRLQAIPEYVQIPAWCADLTETLAPDSLVGLMLPGDERAPGVSPVIRPGYGGAAAYSAERDGQLQPAAASTPAQTALHLARLPFRQRWKPRVRTAVITAISGDTCSVALDDQRSTQQNLPTIPHTGDTPEGEAGAPRTLTEVPITYMDCHGAAFEVGDRVVVTFPAQTWGSAKVVGFYSNPKPCGGPMWTTLTQFAVVAVSQTITDTGTGNHAVIDDGGQITVIGDDGGTLVVDYTVAGEGLSVVNMVAPSVPLGLGGTTSRNVTAVVTQKLNGTGSPIEIMRTTLSVAESFYSQQETSSVPEDCIVSGAEYTSTQTYVFPTVMCESGAYEYWRIVVTVAINSVFGPWDSGPSFFERTFTTNKTQTIDVSLRRSTGEVYFSETITDDETDSGITDVFGKKLCINSGYYGTEVSADLQLQWPIPTQIISRVTGQACKPAPPGAVGEIVSAGGGIKTRKRTGIAPDGYESNEYLILPTHVGGYSNEALPLSRADIVSQTLLIARANLLDPAGAVVLPLP